MPVWRLEQRNLGVVAVEPDSSVGPFTADCVTTEHSKTEVSEERDRCFEVSDGDANVLQIYSHALDAT